MLTIHALTLLLLLLHLLLILLRGEQGGPVGRASCLLLLLLAIGSSSSLKVHVGHPPESVRCVAEGESAYAMSSSGERTTRGVKRAGEGGGEDDGLLFCGPVTRRFPFEEGLVGGTGGRCELKLVALPGSRCWDAGSRSRAE